MGIDPQFTTIVPLAALYYESLITLDLILNLMFRFLQILTAPFGSSYFSTTTSSTSAKLTESASSTSPTAYTGIVIGIVVGIVLLVVLVAILIRRRRVRSKNGVFDSSLDTDNRTGSGLSLTDRIFFFLVLILLSKV